MENEKELIETELTATDEAPQQLDPPYYTVVQHTDSMWFAHYVRENILAGFQCVGGVSIHQKTNGEITYCQAMLKLK
jgi:hypothetical protein